MSLVGESRREDHGCVTSGALTFRNWIPGALCPLTLLPKELLAAGCAGTSKYTMIEHTCSQETLD